MRMGLATHILFFVIINTSYLLATCVHSTDRVNSPNSLHPAILHHLLHREPNSHLHVLASISDHPSYLKRTFLDPAHRRAAETLRSWMHQAGLVTWVDGLANVRGKATAEDESSPAILIGSHYDTVVDAGAYDGALGIIVGIAATKANVLSAAVADGIVTNEQILASINHTMKHGRVAVDNSSVIDVEAIFRAHVKDGKVPQLRRPVQVVAFSDEEGVRFQSTFLGSRGLAGDITEAYLEEVVDRDGVSLRDAIRELGGSQGEGGKGGKNDNSKRAGTVDGNDSSSESTINDVMRLAAGPQELAGYVEVHIEQGPVLEASGERLGVVTGVAGQTWVHVQVRGTQGHAGTVPMGVRRDPMPAVGELVHSLERLCVDRHLLSDSNGSLVCTVGKVEVWPGASNVIPGAVNFTVDVRALSDELRRDVITEFRQTVDDTCRRRQLECEFEVRHEAGAVAMDENLTNALIDAVSKVENESGSIHTDQEDNSSHVENANSKTCRAADQKQVIRMPSGAGHDAIAMASIVPVSMLFVRCKGGISHHPDEYAHPDDVAAAATATYHLIQDWQQRE